MRKSKMNGEGAGRARRLGLGNALGAAIVFVWSGQVHGGDNVGACCTPSGFCVRTTESECEGIFLGVGTTCESDTCDTAWCGAPGAGDCFEPHFGLGCNDENCCLLTCNIDPFCCEVVWDGICADSAMVYCAECPETICAPLCREDFDGNGEVDSGDLLTLLSQWGEKSLRDLSYNVFVDIEDILILLSKWGPCEGDGPVFEEGEACGELINEGCNAPAASGSDCCVPNGTAGCDDSNCEGHICAIDEFCCEVEWDYGCAFDADEFCGTLCDPSPDAFDTINPGETVCGTYFGQDGSGSDWYEFTLDQPAFVTWVVTGDFGATSSYIADTQCPPTKLAVGGFGGLPCYSTTVNACLDAGTYRAVVHPGTSSYFPCDGQNNYTATLVVENEGCLVSADDCADAHPITSGTSYFSTMAADTDGITPPRTCVGGSGFQRDIWFTYEAECTGMLSLSTCNTTTFDTLIAVYDSCNPDDCPPGNDQLIACNSNSPGCGTTTIVNVGVEAGECYKIRIGSSGGGQGVGLLTIECK